MSKTSKWDLFENALATLKDKLKDIDYAEALYASLCNIQWKDRMTNQIVGYTWRASGGLIADLREKDEYYLDFYCTGNEGKIRTDILKDMSKLGYIPLSYDEEEIKTYNKALDADSA